MSNQGLLPRRVTELQFRDIFLANVVLAGGRGERRLRADDDELAIAEDTEHGQLLPGAAAGPATRKPALVNQPSRPGAPSSRRSCQSEVGGQPARLDIIPRSRYVASSLSPPPPPPSNNDIDFCPVPRARPENRPLPAKSTVLTLAG